MPAKKNTPLRLIVPIVVLLAGVGIAILAAQPGPGKPAPAGNTNNQSTAEQPAPEPASDPRLDPEAPEVADEPPAQEPAPQTGALRVRTYDAHPDLPLLGSLDPDSGYEMEVELSPFGLGIESLRLTDYFETLKHKQNKLVQATRPVRFGSTVSTAVPFALTAAVVNGQRLDLTSGPSGEPVWASVPGKGPGAFEAIIENEQGEPVARIERIVSVDRDAHDVVIRQQAFNLSDHPVDFVWVHTGPLSLDPDTGGYGGDKRRLRFGYWLRPESQANDPTVLSDRYTTPFNSVVGVKRENGIDSIPPSTVIWPNAGSTDKGDRLVWIGLTDRYFGVAMHPVPDLDAPDRLIHIDRLTRIAGLDPSAPAGGKRGDLVKNSIVLILAESQPARIPPRGASSFDLGLFAGPLSIPVINAEPIPRALGLSGLVLYNFGGFCAFCTFQPLAHLLLAVLHFLHDTVTHDWALAIIILVIIVRGILHPVTRWSQIRMQRFGVQMQAMQPKMAKLKEKYGDDQKRMQQEMTKLWREEGVNPAGMLGCLPMLLQSPVWIALYATLFFAVELRHEPAFYGVFQSVFPGWPFLADLSRSDNAIPLGSGFSLFGIAHIDAINILPVLLGLVFFFHQKYLTPPPTTTLTPEQESQQKIMKVMMVVLFPLMMYAAPSGLALYFVTNSTLAIVENKWIRAHMKKHGMLDAEKIREQAKARREARRSGGFLARLQQAAAEQQQRDQASKRMMRRVKNTAPERNAPTYKKKKPRK